MQLILLSLVTAGRGDKLRNMTVSDRFRLTSQLAVLREVAADYQGKTIGNIIQQMEARLSEVIKQETI